MKAAVVESAGKLAVREVSEPEMGAYEARCDMLFGAVCAGTDAHLLQCRPPFSNWVKAPFILGHESIGRVSAVGAKVRHLKPGDMVTRVGCPRVGHIGSGWGGFARVGIASDWRAMQEDGVKGWWKKTINQILPADVDPAVGTLFITWRETLSYITRMGVGPNASVLVMGSGGTGLALVSHARNLGATRVTLVGAANRAREAELCGATGFVDYRATACWEQVQTAASDGYDFVIDSVGKAAMTARGQEHLKDGGAIGIYGMDEHGLITLAAGEKTFTFFGGDYVEGEVHDSVLTFYRAGKLNPAVWLDRDRTFALDDIGQALEAARNRTLVKPLVTLFE